MGALSVPQSVFMYVDVFGKPLTESKGALVIKWLSEKKFSIHIWWRHVPSTIKRADEMNILLHGLDEILDYKETKQGCKTIATIGGLRQAYFIRGDGEEVCGCRIVGKEDVQVFRYKLTFAEKSDEQPYLAFDFFKGTTERLLGKSLNAIFGGLPQEYHQFRDCVPPPINWVSPFSKDTVIEQCVKADICSAYGTEGSKPLPDLHASARKVVRGRAKPTEEYPFAFYLISGEMSVYGEGNSWDYAATRYMGNQKRKVVEEDATLLCKAAPLTLEPVFEYLYNGRKDNEWYKFVMVASVGMFHRRKFTGEETNLWPLAAVIKFRCNKRIVDYCNQLIDMYQAPLLINTDSITWRGTDTSITTKEKKLGNFALEHANCSLLYSGPKKYQVRDDDDGTTITRWSGNHRKTLTEKLAFGEILNPKIIKTLEEQEKKATFKWDKTKRRFVNKFGDIYVLEDFEETMEDLQ